MDQVKQDAACLERGLSEVPLSSFFPFFVLSFPLFLCIFLIIFLQIQSSKKLERIMELVLHIGNYINTGTHRGKCDGFKVSTLRRLADFRRFFLSFFFLSENIYFAQFI